MLQTQNKKEDLRIIRTREKIYSQFLKMRRKKPIENIRITDLCNEAGINRATFYHHYADIYALSDEIEYAVIDKCLSHLSRKDIRLFYTDPKEFMRKLKEAIDSHMNEIALLSNGRMEKVFAKIEEKIVEFLMDGREDEELHVQLTYVIGGVIHVIYTYSSGRVLKGGALRDIVCRMIYNSVKDL